MEVQILKKMIDFCHGSIHDIHHLIKVRTYAVLIGEAEHLDAETLRILEIAAIVHDIACPSLRARFGKCDPHLQEQEGPALAEALLADCNLSETEIARVSYLVAHHHTFSEVNGMDYQILLEADYLVNANGHHDSPEAIRLMYENVFKTDMGKALLKSIYAI